MTVTADGLTTNNDQVKTKPHKFVIKNVFKNVSNMRKDEDYCYTEDHFGLQWSICVRRQEDFLGVYFQREGERSWGKLSVDAEIEVIVFHPNGKLKSSTATHCLRPFERWAHDKFMTWETMEKEYLTNDDLTVEYRVRIINTTGIYGENLRNFDDEKCSDVTLVVKYKSFHVSKLYLSSHSPYFKTMFLGGFEESKQSEVKLSGVDGDDLQKYLEALYGEDAIDETTVEGILLLADMYDTKILVQKCGKFLLEKSKKTLKKKLEMAVRYSLYELKNKCFSEIKTIADVRSVVPGCIDQMGPSLMAVLFEKTLALA